jgi:hypothetical protein
VIGLFSPEEIQEKMKNIRPTTGAGQEARAQVEEALMKAQSEAKKKTKKKPKKKSNKAAAQADLLFEGGDNSKKDSL